MLKIDFRGIRREGKKVKGAFAVRGERQWWLRQDDNNGGGEKWSLDMF